MPKNSGTAPEMPESTCKLLEARGGIEPPNKGFADPLPYHSSEVLAEAKG